jgi:hypothetical protein
VSAVVRGVVAGVIAGERVHLSTGPLARICGARAAGASSIALAVSGPGNRSIALPVVVTLACSGAVPGRRTAVTLPVSSAGRGAIALAVSCRGPVALPVAVSLSVSVIGEVVAEDVAEAVAVGVVMVMMVMVPGVLVPADVVEQAFKERDEFALVHSLEHASASALLPGALLHLIAGGFCAARDSALVLGLRQRRG